jgi:hypothetical protein
MHPVDLARWLERWRSSDTSAEPWEPELRLRRFDGAEVAPNDGRGATFGFSIPMAPAGPSGDPPSTTTLAGGPTDDSRAMRLSYRDRPTPRYDGPVVFDRTILELRSRFRAIGLLRRHVRVYHRLDP